MPAKYTVLTYEGKGFGPISDWAIYSWCTSAREALETQNIARKLGFVVRTRLTEELGL